VFPNRFSLAHWGAWRSAFDTAFELAELSKELNIVAVKFDFERWTQLNSVTGVPSYDDGAWQMFCQAHSHGGGAVPAKQRGQWLRQHKLTKAYDQWWQRRLNQIAQHMEKRMHAINPDLVLGMMPANFGISDQKRKRLYPPFAKHLATERVPAIMDVWRYNVRYRDNWPKQVKQLKALNENNIVVPWITPRNITPKQIYTHGHALAAQADGFSVWNMQMTSTSILGHNRHALAPGVSIEQYFDAYGKLNDRLKRGRAVDLANLPTLDTGSDEKDTASRAQRRQKQASRVKLNLQPPALAPAEPAAGREVEPKTFTLRQANRAFTYRQAGQPVQAQLKRRGGGGWIAYGVVGPEGETLLRSAMAPNEKQVSIEVPSQRTGTYAICVNSGGAGAPRYDLTIAGPAMGLDLRNKLYLYKPPHQPPMWVAGVSGAGQGTLRIATGKGQMLHVTLADQQKQEVRYQKPVNLALREALTGPVRIVEPEHINSYGLYAGDIFLTAKAEGIATLTDAPERALVPAGLAACFRQWDSAGY
jgi:hypothetical protein